jgi:hypothetical protein
MDDERRLPDDDTELTRVTPPGDDATRVMPPAGEGETQVMPAADTGATRVMPGAGEAPPPPPPNQPTLLMTHGRGDEGGGVPWWAWLLVILAILAVAAGLWYFYLRPADSTTAGDEFLGHWSPQSGGGGGLVIKQSGEQFAITQYDGQLQNVGTTTADLVDGELTLSVQASAVGLTGVTGKVQGTLTHESADDLLKLQFTAGDLAVEPVYFVRVDVLLPATPSPTPTPTASPSPTATPSPTTTATASPSPTGSPTADQEVVANIARLQVGIVAWAADNNNLYPPPQDVVEGGGLSQYVTPWPTNPFTSVPMAPGTAPGNYVYEQLSGGQAYKITGYLSNGLTYSVP